MKTRFFSPGFSGKTQDPGLFYYRIFSTPLSPKLYAFYPGYLGYPGTGSNNFNRLDPPGSPGSAPEKEKIPTKPGELTDPCTFRARPTCSATSHLSTVKLCKLL